MSQFEIDFQVSDVTQRPLVFESSRLQGSIFFFFTKLLYVSLSAQTLSQDERKFTLISIPDMIYTCRYIVHKKLINIYPHDELQNMLYSLKNLGHIKQHFPRALQRTMKDLKSKFQSFTKYLFVTYWHLQCVGINKTRK